MDRINRILEHPIFKECVELNKMAEQDRSIDDLLDNKTTELGKTLDHVVFDSRLAWNFVEESFKVFLSVSLPVAASRVLADASRGAVESYASVEECMAGLKERAATEDRRYKEIYGIEYFNYSNYNLVLDSSDCAPEILAKILVEEAKAAEERLAKGEPLGSKLILCKDRPAEDFAKEKTEGTVSTQTLCGVEFTVIEL